MTGWAELDRLLDTDPRDGGCERARELLDIYAELILVDPAAARARHRDVAAHVHACLPCAEDLEGVLQALAHWRRS